MPTFQITSPQGQTYKIDGPEGATEQQALQMLQRKLSGMPDAPPQPPAEKPPSGILSRIGYELKGIPSGLVRGLASTASASGQAAQTEMGQEVTAPGTEETKKLLEQHVTGETPKGGRYGEAVGEALSSPGTYVAPGGPLLKAAGAVGAGLGGEAAASAAAGTKFEPYARMLGGLAGGLPFGKWRTTAPKPGSPAPLVDELHAASDQQYKAVRALDLRLAPEPVSKVAGDIANKLGDRGFSATNVPETFAVLDRLRKPAGRGAFVGAQDFDNARQELLQATRNSQNLREGPAAWQAIESMDKYLSNIPATHVIRGDAKAASRLFDEARGNWAAMKRLEMAGGKLELGKLNADTSHSGMNTDNAIRQAVKQLIRPNKYGKTLAEQHGFNEREIKAMNEIARGTAATNTLRYFGNLLGGGGGIGTAALTLAGAGLGYETGHPELAGLGLVGHGLRRGAGAMTERQARQLLEMVARRSPAGGGGMPAPRLPGQAAQSVGSSALRGLTYGGPQ